MPKCSITFFIIIITAACPQIISQQPGEPINTNQDTAKFTFKYKLDPNDSEFLIKLADSNLPLSASADLAGNINIPDDLMKAEGSITIKNGGIFYKKQQFANDIKAQVNIRNSILTTPLFTATVLQAPARATLTINNTFTDPNFKGALQIDDLDADSFFRIFLPDREITEGTADFEIKFSGQTDPNSLQTKGLITLDDADLWKLPFVSKLLSFSGFASKEGRSYLKAEAIFTSNDYEVTFQKLLFYNDLIAVKLEDGFTLNLKTNQVNGFANVIGVAKIREQIDIIPLFSDLLTFTDTLTRIKIQGDYTQPAEKLLSKQPIEDIGKGTLDFLRDITNLPDGEANEPAK